MLNIRDGVSVNIKKNIELFHARRNRANIGKTDDEDILSALCHNV